MTKKLRIILITILAAVCALCVISGCKLQSTVEDIVKLKDLKAKVTYFAGGGEFSDDHSSLKTLYFPEGARPLDVGVESNDVLTGSMGGTRFSGGKFTVDRYNHTLVGWFLINVNENGVPLYDDGSLYDSAKGVEEGKSFSLSEEKYTFETLLEDGDNLYLWAKWLANSRVEVLLGGEDGYSITDTSGKTYTAGSVISSYSFDSGRVTRPNRPARSNTATFIEYYYDRECTQLYDAWPIPEPEEGDITVYAKYIDNVGGKEWEVVKTPANVRSMFSSLNGTKNYYIFNDIDCGSLENTVCAATTSVAIMGNGHTISNLKVTSAILRSGNSASLFGNISESARISDITFENLQCSYTLFNDKTSVNVHFAFTSISSEAKISGVNINGSLTVTKNGGTIQNALNGTNNIKFGGFDNDSDYTGMNVEVAFTEK